MLKCNADGKIEDTGPLTRKRMETVDEEFLTAALDFIERQHKAGQAVLLLVQLDADARLYAPQGRSPRARPGLGLEPTAWWSTTGTVGQLLKKLDELGIAEQHDRRLHHRQRRRGDDLAGRRHDAFPRREGHQLGGRLPRADC